jgi:hypothetical protein
MGLATAAYATGVLAVTLALALTLTLPLTLLLANRWSVGAIAPRAVG